MEAAAQDRELTAIAGIPGLETDILLAAVFGSVAAGRDPRVESPGRARAIERNTHASRGPWMSGLFCVQV